MTVPSAASAGRTSLLTLAVCASTAKRLAARCICVPMSCIALRHEGRDVRGAMKFERTHAQTLLGDGRCLVERVLGKGNVDFLQRQQMVAHAGDRVQAHRLGKLDQLPGIGLGGSGSGHRMLVLLRNG